MRVKVLRSSPRETGIFEMNREHGFNQFLGQVAPVVAAMRVDEFVQDNLFQFGV